MRWWDDYGLYVIVVIFTALLTADVVIDLGLTDPITHNPKFETHKVRFSEVKPVFENRCKSCHYQPHWDWTKYETAYPKRHTIKTRVWVLRNMPAGGKITEDERKLIRDWVNDGGLQ